MFVFKDLEKLFKLLRYGARREILFIFQILKYGAQREILLVNNINFTRYIQLLKYSVQREILDMLWHQHQKMYSIFK